MSAARVLALALCALLSIGQAKIAESMSSSVPESSCVLDSSSLMQTETDVATKQHAAIKIESTALQKQFLEHVPADDKQILGKAMFDAPLTPAIFVEAKHLAIFCGGVVVGVALTVLILTCLRDSSKQANVEDGQPESAQEEQRGSATGSLESMHLFWPRCHCLVWLLLVQSLSSLIVEGYGHIFSVTPQLVFFLTMIVGTGGNVGGQSVVLAVRQLALGENVSVYGQFMIGLKLSCILVPLAFLRCMVQVDSWMTCFTVASSVFLIIILAASLGAATPKLLCLAKCDPAHATPIIQVLMDILGVFIVCIIGWLWVVAMRGELVSKTI